VSPVARVLGVSRSTIYKCAPGLASPSAIAGAGSAADAGAGGRGADAGAAPSAGLPDGYHPTSTHEVAQHREELDTVWLFTDADQTGHLVERWHRSGCQPHQVEIIMCRLCGTTVMLGGDLAAEHNQLPACPSSCNGGSRTAAGASTPARGAGSTPLASSHSPRPNDRKAPRGAGRRLG
jgi:hypothetical protein